MPAFRKIRPSTFATAELGELPLVGVLFICFCQVLVRCTVRDKTPSSVLGVHYFMIFVNR